MSSKSKVSGMALATGDPSGDHSATPSQPSLTRLLLSSHLALAATILLCFAGVMFTMNYRATYSKVESELIGAAEILSEQLEQGVSPDKFQIPNAFFHRFGKAERDHAYWRLWDSSDMPLASHGKIPDEAVPNVTPPPRDGKHAYVTRKYGRHFDLLVATPSGGQILVGRPMAKEYDAFGRLLASLAGVFLVGLIAAALMAWWLTKWLVTPIKSFAQAAGSITHRQIDQRLTYPQATQEMSQLASAFNTMMNELQSAFVKQQRFTSDAAHELRTPVSIITSQSELTLSRPRDVAYYQQSLSTCLQASSHMKVLVDQLLELSRLDGNRNFIDYEIVDLGVVAKECVAMLDSLASQNGVTIEIAIRSVQVRGVPTRLRQVVLNLLTNAIQFSNGGIGFQPVDAETQARSLCHVFVSVSSEQDSAVLMVKDDGVGIAAANIPHLCDRFFRVDQARTTADSSGTGLGLSIVAEIVRGHGGEMSIESQLQVGTTIRVTLPMSVEKAMEHEREPIG